MTALGTLPSTGVLERALKQLTESDLILMRGGLGPLADEFAPGEKCPPCARELVTCCPRKIDDLTLRTGLKIEIRFDRLICFSTNHDPGELVDEAFPRRIRFKVPVNNPMPEQSPKISERMCEPEGSRHSTRRFTTCSRSSTRSTAHRPAPFTRATWWSRSGRWPSSRTGRRVTIGGMLIYRLHKGQTGDGWARFDTYGFIRQSGATSALESVPGPAPAKPGPGGAEWLGQPHTLGGLRAARPVRGC